MTAEEWWESVRAQRWYAVVNDLIGGWAVSNVDKPLGDLRASEHQFAVADFICEQGAEHVAFLHNTWLDEQ